MVDKEKLIRGLHCCAHTDGIECPNCPYWHDDDCVEMLMDDALAMLKEQEERKNFKVADLFRQFADSVREKWG